MATTRLSEFCFMPLSDQREDYLDHVAAAALEENWGQERTYLRNYVSDNFEIAFAQGRVREHPDKLYAIWRVGTLTTREGEPISILALKNRQSGKQPYHYTATMSRRRFPVRLDTGEVMECAPESPRYEPPPYHPEHRLVYNFGHYLDVHEDRVLERLPTLTTHQRFLCIYAALDLAHKRGEHAAVAQWYRDKNADAGGYQWLLPLHIKNENISEKPDLVAALQPIEEYQEYNIPTLLPPEWAYGHARAVSGRDPHFRSWA